MNNLARTDRTCKTWNPPEPEPPADDEDRTEIDRSLPLPY